MFFFQVKAINCERRAKTPTLKTSAFLTEQHLLLRADLVLIEDPNGLTNDTLACG